MTEKEKAEDVLENRCVTLPYHKKYDVTDLVTVPTFDTKYAIVPVPEETRMVNFSSGIAAFTLDKLVQHQDLMVARERIKTNHEEGMSYKEKLKKMKTITAGQIFKAKGYRIGKDINAIYIENSKTATEELQVIVRKKKAENEVLQNEASAVLALNLEIHKY